MDASPPTSPSPGTSRRAFTWKKPARPQGAAMFTFSRNKARAATTPPVPIDPATASASDQGDDSPLAVLSGAASTTPPNEPEAQTPPMSTPEKRRWRLGSKAVPAVAKAKQGVSRVVHRVFESTALPTPHVEESWASKAMQSIIVTVVEGRALPTRLSLVAVECERSIYVAKPVAGSDPLWAVPVMDGSDNLHPNENHFVVPVVDVCNSLLHFRLHDASDMNAGAPVAFAALSVSSLLALGGGFAGEITRWLVLQSFDDTYTPVREKLGALETALKGAKPVAPKGVEAKPLGYLNVRIKLKFPYSRMPTAIPSMLLSPAYLGDEMRHAPSSTPLEGEEHPVDLERLRLLAGRLRKVTTKASVVARLVEWPGVLLALPLLYHLCFSAPVWEYPLLVLALVIGQGLEGFFRRRRIASQAGHSASLLCKKDIAPPKGLKQKAKQLRFLVNQLQDLLETVVPALEKLRYALSFHEPNVSLVVMCVLTSLCLTTALLLLLLPTSLCAFCAGLAVLLPIIAKGGLEAALGAPLAVYDLSLKEGRGLAAFDVGGTSDPYLVSAMKTITDAPIKTEVIKKTLTPVWNETFRVALPPFPAGEIALELFDRDVGMKDDRMGSLTVRPTAFTDCKERWFPVEGGQGEILVGLHFVGSTWESYKRTPHAFWREWPSVVRASAFVSALLPGAVVGVFSWRHFLHNLYDKLPTYAQVRSVAVTHVTYFRDVNHVVPRPSK